MSDPIRIGPPLEVTSNSPQDFRSPPEPESVAENDFSDFMPTGSQIEAAITMYNGGYTVTQIRAHFESIGCTPVVVDGLTTRVLDLALASLIRSQATEMKITERLRELGLQPHQIEQFRPHILEGQARDKHQHARNGDGWFFASFFAAIAAIFTGLFVGGGTVPTIRSMRTGKSLAEQSRQRSKRRR